MRNIPYWLNIGSILHQYGCATRASCNTCRCTLARPTEAEVCVQASSNLTKVAKLRENCIPRQKIARSWENVNIAQTLRCARSQYSGGTIKECLSSDIPLFIIVCKQMITHLSKHWKRTLTEAV